MKNQKNKIRKVCNVIRTDEVYFTNSEWGECIVEDMTFLPVVKNDPSIVDKGPQEIYYIRKDYLKFL